MAYQQENVIIYEGKMHPDFFKALLLGYGIISAIVLSIILVPFLLFSTMMIEIFDLNGFISSIYPILVGVIAIICAIIFLVIFLQFIYLSFFKKNYFFKIYQDKIEIHYGVFNRAISSIPFTRIQNLAVRQSFFWRPFKVWAIDIETAGGGLLYRGALMRSAEGSLLGLKDPDYLKGLIMERINVAKRGFSFSGSPMVASTGSINKPSDLQAGGVEARIKELSAEIKKLGDRLERLVGTFIKVLEGISRGGDA
ncbi:MAG: PH domain-containing protein [Promethearchaeota archaeon]